MVGAGRWLWLQMAEKFGTRKPMKSDLKEIYVAGLEPSVLSHENSFDAVRSQCEKIFYPELKEVGIDAD